MSGWTAFWVMVAIPAGLGCGIWIAREFFDVDLIKLFRRD